MQLLANRNAKAAAEEDSLQIIKIVMIHFFTALNIDHVLMRFNAFRMEVIEIRWADSLGPCHASF